MATAPPRHGAPSRAPKPAPKRESAHRRGYGRRWEKARNGYLRNHPLCVHCEADQHLSSASVVDHIVPHRGDMMLIWDRSNWQGLCKAHHDRKTAAEDGGFGNATAHPRHAPH